MTLAALLVPLCAVTTDPQSITVATSRGEAEIAVRQDHGHAALAAFHLERLLPVTKHVAGGWGEVRFADQPFRFLLDAPVMVHAGRIIPLVGGAYVARDTLFVPLQWLTEHIPRTFGAGYRYDPSAARFEETRLGPGAAGAAAPAPLPRFRTPTALARRHGFRMQHRLTVDAGHGGRDHGNPGVFFPRGIQEKHVTLGIAKRLQEELERRGVEVVMTRTSDEFVPLGERAPRCRDDCDLFVSIHVNSLEPRGGYQAVSGIETYFLGDQLTADAARVARMENEALKYEADWDGGVDDALSFILKDLQTNAYLHESALLAQAVQRNVARRHPGEDRGVAQARFVVLATARRPAVLVETGFATNRRDAQYLLAPSGQSEIAAAIADGIVAYLLQYEAKVLAGGGGP